MLEREHRLTPMKTVTDGVDVFINPKSKVTGASCPVVIRSVHVIRDAENLWSSLAGQIIEK